VVDLTDPPSAIPRICGFPSFSRTQETLLPPLGPEIHGIFAYNVPTVRKVGGSPILGGIAASVSVSNNKKSEPLEFASYKRKEAIIDGFLLL
jgi:hypothetical protein